MLFTKLVLLELLHVNINTKESRVTVSEHSFKMMTQKYNDIGMNWTSEKALDIQIKSKLVLPVNTDIWNAMKVIKWT